MQARMEQARTDTAQIEDEKFSDLDKGGNGNAEGGEGRLAGSLPVSDQRECRQDHPLHLPQPPLLFRIQGLGFGFWVEAILHVSVSNTMKKTCSNVHARSHFHFGPVLRCDIHVACHFFACFLQVYLAAHALLGTEAVLAHTFSILPKKMCHGQNPIVASSIET